MDFRLDVETHGLIIVSTEGDTDGIFLERDVHQHIHAKEQVLHSSAPSPQYLAHGLCGHRRRTRANGTAPPPVGGVDRPRGYSRISV